MILVSDAVIDDVVVKKGTPGIATNVGENWLTVSFEEGTSLDFGSDEKHRPYWDGKYSFFAKDWHQGIGSVDLDGEIYTATNKSGFAYLLIDKESLSGVMRNKRVLVGRRLQQ